MSELVEEMKKRANERNSRIVLAFDAEVEGDYEIYIKIIEKIKESLVGIKIGYPTILNFGLDKIEQTITKYRKEGITFIADVKLSDVGHINLRIAKILFKRKFDAVIAHGFVGFEGALDELRKAVEEERKAMFIVATMSHKAASVIMDKVLEDTLRESLRAKPDGFIVPATRPEIIKKVKQLLPRDFNGILLSPGVGAQGAAYGSAIREGADFEIIGRAIYNAVDPEKEVRNIIKAQESALKKRINL